MKKDCSYREKKVMTMKTVTEMTGLSERQIRYYKAQNLIFPARNSSLIRRYSFSDIEELMDIAEKIEEGVLTREIREDLGKKRKTTNRINTR
ncbi:MULTISPECIES: MerR family transcriptional regulator [unclassified Priestia]|uniref:MerR family transcriptional regulator n=1 Tax=unclassified Priestia TaxID=2800374 RepID=UPI00366F3C3D